MQQRSIIVRACHRFLLAVFPAVLSLLAVGLASPAARGQAFNSLCSFRGPDDGTYPQSGVVQAIDGNFYGTTAGGGVYNQGTIFRLTPDGTLTTLYSFAGTDGSDPRASLVQANDGNLYGTTFLGGAHNQGTVFRITLGGTLTTLHDFNGYLSGSEGAYPQAGLVQASDGNLYGTTQHGGAHASDGTIFRIALGGILTTLYSFAGTDGVFPLAGLVQASDGNLYGTTEYGGANDEGTVFRITLGGTLTTLYSFSALSSTYANTDGAEPFTGLIQASDGSLYGTTFSGGANNGGTVFRLTLGGTFTNMHSFGTTYTDGARPWAGLKQASDGNIYSTTWLGGTNGYGTIFRLTLGGTFTNLYSFNQINQTGEANPLGSLIQASDGNLYGTTSGDTAYSLGTVFRITLGGTLMTVHTFTGSGTDGYSPQASLFQANDGNLYGTTQHGGAHGDGTVFRLTLGGTLTTLYSFAGSDGAYPLGSLFQANDGNLYGTTFLGGAYNLGTVFRITLGGTLTTLYSFAGTDGALPYANLIQATDGNLYGTTQQGGSSDWGTVFRITLGGTLTTLYTFGALSFADGVWPQAGLIQASDGNLYGTTSQAGANDYGTVFQLTLAGTLATVHSFSSTGTDGLFPWGGLFQANDENLYGTTRQGPGEGNGTVFRITLGGTLTTLYDFAVSGVDGGLPQCSLIQASDGNLYGATPIGGANNSGGTIFRLALGGTLTTLHSFSGTDGSDSIAGLIQATDSNLYGTTVYGGDYGSGTIYQLALKPTSIKSLSINPSLVTGGQNAVGTVNLTAPASINTDVQISSANPAASAPATVIVPKGKASQTFTITTTAVSTNTTGAIKATVNGVTLSKSLTVIPISVKSLSIKPNPVAGSLKTTGTVTLQSPAAPGAITVALASSNTAVANPAVSSITIAAGATTGTFTISTSAVSAKTNVTLTATANSQSKSATLTVRPIGVQSVTLVPNSTTGGNDVVGVVTLEGKAAPGSIIVTLASSNPNLAPVPASITVAAGKLNGSFTISTGAVTTTTTVTISATANGITKTARLTLTP